MNALHTANILAQSQAAPFTFTDARVAEHCIMGRYTRKHLRAVLNVRRMLRRSLAEAIATKQVLQAMEVGRLVHSYAVQAVILVRRNARHTHV